MSNLNQEQRQQLKLAVDRLDVTLPFTFDLYDLLEIHCQDYGAIEVEETAAEVAQAYLEKRGLAGR